MVSLALQFVSEVNKWYQSERSVLREIAMAKKSADGEMGAATPSLKLSKTNYRVWSMTMEVYLDSHDLWQTILGENPTKKKDRQALSAIMSGVPEDLLGILDAKKTAKENWELLRQQNLGVDRVIQSRIQGLRRDLEMLTMGKSDSVMDFAMKFTHIISDLRNLGEVMEEKEVVRRFLRATPAKFDALTLSLEQYGELDKVSLDEVIGSLTIHELRLKERETREEEQILLAKAMSKTKISNEEESSSRGKGRHRGRARGRGKGRGRGRNQREEEEKDKKTFDKSIIQCYNCQRYGHFAYECRNPKKPREDKAYVAEATPATAASASSSNMVVASSSLLMAVVEEVSDLLLHGSEGASSDPALWYLDTGATNHMSGCREFFNNLDETTTGFVKFGDNSRIQIKGKGEIEVNQKDGSTLRLCHVLFVPKLEANILSLGRLDEEGYRMIVGEGKLTIFNPCGQLFAEVHRSSGRLYLLKLNIVDQCLIMSEDNAEEWLWHSRFGHLNFHTLQEMSRKNSVEGLPSFVIPRKICRSCVAGKHHRTSFPKKSPFRATEPLELIHIDICGPITPTTLGGSRYFLLIIDDFSRLTWVSMLQCKSDAFEAFKHFKNLAETEKGMKIKTLRSDRGGEFTSDEFTNYCLKYGIKRQLTAPYSPQQNGVVERKNRTVVSMVRAMLKAKDLPRELWGEAISTAVYILNRSSSKTLQGQTPYEMWTGRKPSVDHMRTFGSIAHVKVTKGHLSKLEDKSQPMIFIGYELGTKAYKCFDPVNSKVIISRDAIFEENEKWTWSTQGENSHSLTFLPNFLSDQAHEDHIEPSDEEEEASTEVNSSSNVSRDMHSPRYRSLTDLYPDHPR